MKFKMKEQNCQFCGKNKAEESITDGETEQEILICQECNDLHFFKVPEKAKKIEGFKDMTIQELEKKIDEIVDNDIEYMKECREGLI